MTARETKSPQGSDCPLMSTNFFLKYNFPINFEIDGISEKKIKKFSEILLSKGYVMLKVVASTNVLRSPNSRLNST